MKVVADAGPLIALAKIDRLGLLADLFDEVCLPEVVEHEILAKAGPETKRIEAALVRFLRVMPAPYDLAAHLEPVARGLGAGECAVIAVAATLPPPVSVLMDDAAGGGEALRQPFDPRRAVSLSNRDAAATRTGEDGGQTAEGGGRSAIAKASAGQARRAGLTGRESAVFVRG